MIDHRNLSVLVFLFSEIINTDYTEQALIAKFHLLGHKLLYKKHSSIFIQGEKGKFLHILESGKIKIVLENNKQQTIAIKEDNSIFGCVIIFSDIPFYPASAYAEKASVINRIDKQEAESFISNDSKLLNLWIKFVTMKSYKFTQNILNISLNDAIGKVCYFIIESIEKSHFRKECEGYVIENINQSVISDYTGLTRETVSRIFNRLIKLNIIDKCNQKIIVKDLEKLKLFVSVESTQ